MKWLWVESHFSARLSKYAWISNTSLIYGMAITLFSIWMNLNIFIFVIQERCFANILLKKISYFLAYSVNAENIFVVSIII